METELGEERQNFIDSGPHPVPMNSMPEPKPPLAVALDGAYVHAAGNEERKEKWFEVVVSPEQQKLLRTIREFGNYIADNQAYIPDYGDRHRNGERTSSAFAEPAVNQLVSRRMVKRQQMHWAKRGAHLLLQVRAQVMNGDPCGTFRRQYPGMKAGSEDQIHRAA
jgi:hypothetical protein